jgi:FkbM family methyltransferase
MRLINKFCNKLQRLFKEFIFRDRNLIANRKWLAINGDETLRYKYELNSRSLVFDVGGYKGDFTDDIIKLFDCHVYLFEPVPSHFKYCKNRFKKNPKVTCFNFGLSDRDKHDFISIENDASSTIRKFESPIIKIKFKSISNFFKTRDIKGISLIKLNIEGGEYELLTLLINLNLIKKIKFLQIQFHDFFLEAQEYRKRIRHKLSKTHNEMWCYDFVWESWKKK